MITVYMNETFNEMSSLILAIKKKYNGVRFIASGTGKKKYKVHVTKYIAEKTGLTDSEYIEECLYICELYKVDMFFVQNRPDLIMQDKERFENIGVRLICNELDVLNILYNDRESFYKMLENLGKETTFSFNALVPRYQRFDSKEDFIRACVSARDDIAILTSPDVKDIQSKSKFIKVIQQINSENIFNNYENYKSISDIQSLISLMSREQFNDLLLLRDISESELVMNCIVTNYGVKTVCYDIGSDTTVQSKFFERLAKRLRDRFNLVGAFHVHLRIDTASKIGLNRNIKIIDIHNGFSKEVSIIYNEYNINLLEELLLGDYYEEDICNRA